MHKIRRAVTVFRASRTSRVAACCLLPDAAGRRDPDYLRTTGRWRRRLRLGYDARADAGRRGAPPAARNAAWLGSKAGATLSGAQPKSSV